MRGGMRRFIALVAVISLLVPATALGIAARDVTDKASWANKSDKRSHPLGDKQADLKKKALEAVLKGKAQGPTYEVEPGVFVPLGLEGEDNVWTVPGEFADYPHNSILEPDREVDNSTIWVEDFSQEYYLELLFAEGQNSMREYFLEQSSGAYTVTGDVTEWVSCPGQAADYDDGDPGPGDADHVWQFLTDSLNGWYEMQVEAGASAEEIDAYLADFDVWDRYDYDHDGDFDEPDGYIDHFQSLHSGEGNEAGGGALGDDAIWSHSWYAYYGLIGDVGPTVPDDDDPDEEPQENLLGGVRIGDSSYWVGDYTIQPENGGVGVFTHEFTHDLGIPDLYDTSGAGENATGFWTLMSSGSWLSDNDYDIGSMPGHQGPWEKLNLGWLDYEIVESGKTTELTIGPSEAQTTRPQAIIVNLPDKLVEEDIGDPYDGEYFWWSGSGDDLDNVMYKEATLPVGATLEAMVYYEIESNWDYAYVVVSNNGGLTWQSVPTNLSTDTDPNGQNFGFGITGSTRKWTKLTADLSAYDGDTVFVGFRYWTDGALTEPGFMVDNVSIAGGTVDGAEEETGWTYDGFKRTTGFESGYYPNYYIAEYRQYWGYDATLANAYNFGFQKGKDQAINLVEHFAYQDGLLVWYCDDSQSDNNTSAHPGYGFALPVDAHPDPLIRPDKKVWRNRVQTLDATFGLEATEGCDLHWNSRLSVIPSLAAVPTFDDSNSYWSAANPTGSVIVPVTGTSITVLGTAPGASGEYYMALSVTAPHLTPGP